MSAQFARLCSFLNPPDSGLHDEKPIALGILPYPRHRGFGPGQARDQIKFRQAGYSFMSWNMGKIKANLEGEYNAQQVQAAATAIAGIAGSGIRCALRSRHRRTSATSRPRVSPSSSGDAERRQARHRLQQRRRQPRQGRRHRRQGRGAEGLRRDRRDCKACHDKYRME